MVSLYLSFIIEYNMKRFIEDALTETNTSIASYWEDKLYADAIKVYLQVWRTISNTHEDYFWNYWYTDLQEGASEYELQGQWLTSWDDTIPWIDKVKKVYIKDADGNYNEIPQLSDLQERDGMKGWTIKDKHLILSWTPEDDVEDWIKLEGTICPNYPDMSSDDSADLFPYHEELWNYQPVLASWIKWKLWLAKQDFDKANLAKAEFYEGQEEMRRYIAERVQGIYYTNLTY